MPSTKKKTTSGPIKLQWDEAAKTVGKMVTEDFFEAIADVGIEEHSHAYDAAISEGASDEEAEEAAGEAEREAQKEPYNDYENTLERAFEWYFDWADLDVTVKQGVVILKPKKSWRDSANKVRELINGVGEFHFNTLKQFLDSGPYGAREAVVEHLGYVSYAPKIYGGGPPGRGEWDARRKGRRSNRGRAGRATAGGRSTKASVRIGNRGRAGRVKAGRSTRASVRLANSLKR